MKLDDNIYLLSTLCHYCGFFLIGKFLACRGVEAGWAGWARAHPPFCLTFIKKGHLPTCFSRITFFSSEVRGGPCNPSYWEDGI